MSHLVSELSAKIINVTILTGFLHPPSLLSLLHRSEARHGAGYVGDGVREGREALPPHDQGQPH